MYFSGTKFCSLVLSCLLPLSMMAKDAKQATVGGGLGKPVSFIENKGQLRAQDNKACNDIQYKLSTPGMNLFVGNCQLHYQFRKVEGNSPSTLKLSMYRMDVTLLGADPAAKVTSGEEQAYYENYIMPGLGDDNGVTAHAYNRIVYKNVYPSIDWVLYVKDNNVEYDFVVRPGGNVNDIKLKYGGATKLSVTNDGSLTAITPMGTVTEKTPYAYETATGRKVATDFKLNKNIVSFKTGDYNGSLTIDPLLSWGTYFGSTLEDVITAIKEDNSHNSYVCGYTSSTSGIASGGAYQFNFTGGPFDMFFAKFSSTGLLNYATYYAGNPGTTEATCLALDNAASPNIYIGGYTTCPNGGGPPPHFTNFGAYQQVNNGGDDGFLLKLNNAGTRQWCTFIGGTGNDFVYGVATDASGNNVYITGQTASTTSISTGGSYQAAISGPTDAFLAKFNSSGAIQWSTYYGGTAQETGIGVVCDGLGNIDITGQTNSVISIASAGAYQGSLSGTQDAFIAQFNSAGTRNWGTYFGGTSTEIGNGIASDGGGNLAVVGNTTSGSGVASVNAFQTAYGGVQDAFVAYLTNNGTLQWSSYYGGSGFDYGQAVCFDVFGNPVIVGGTFSTTGIATLNSSQAAIGGDYDAFIAKINPLGQMFWDSYFGGSFYDYANGVASDASNGQLVIAGYSSSNGLYGAGGISTTGTYQAANAGGVYDGFVAKINLESQVSILQPFTDTLACAGGTLNVYTTVPAIQFTAGNVFSVQLSDATGNFAGAVTIGTLTGTGAGTIVCTIPGAASGTGYRIRVVASNPAFTSPDDYYNIHIVPSIPATTATSNSPVCASGTLRLYDAAPYTLSAWSWAGPAGFTSTVQNPVISSVTAAYTGTYSVTATHNGCPAAVSTVAVIVNSTLPPTPSVGVSAVCQGDTLFLSANPDTTATGLTWNWSGPGGFTSTKQNPFITPSTLAEAGNYYVNDTLQGCPSLLQTDIVVVNATTPVSANITATPGYTYGAAADTLCLGTMVNFAASAVNGGSSPSYQWYAGGIPVVGAISNTWASATLTNGELVYCSISSSELCPSPVHAPSNTILMNMIDNAPLVYITASPGAHVSPGTTVTFTSSVYNGGTSPSYQWFKNGLPIAGANADVYTLTSVNAPDTIYLQVKSNMQCPLPDSIGNSNVLIAESNVGVTQVSALLTDIDLYPNPNGGAFAIRGTVAGNSLVTYSVTNILSQVITTGSITPINNQLEKTIGLGDISDGIYLLHLSQNGQSKVIRFSVQKQ